MMKEKKKNLEVDLEEIQKEIEEAVSVVLCKSLLVPTSKFRCLGGVEAPLLFALYYCTDNSLKQTFVIPFPTSHVSV